MRIAVKGRRQLRAEPKVTWCTVRWQLVGFGADKTSRMRHLQGSGSGVECEIDTRGILDLAGQDSETTQQNRKGRVQDVF